MLVTAGMIARLQGRPRKWAQRRMKAGVYGPIMGLRGRWPYVDLAEVEAEDGRSFASEQLLAAEVSLWQTPGGGLMAFTPKKKDAGATIDRAQSKRIGELEAARKEALL